MDTELHSHAERQMALPCFCLPFVLLAAGCAPTEPAAESLYELSGPTMGTRYSIKVVADNRPTVEKLKLEIDARLVEINDLMSTYIEDSELSRFNNSGTTTSMAISSETASVVSAALELANDSEGAFDPTVGPLVDLWGFGTQGRRRRPPTDDEIEQARQRVGFDKIELNTRDMTLRRSDSAVELNLSAIAKGYGVDAVAELLESSGVDNYMVEIGGEIRVRGSKPDNEPWRLGIERPQTEQRSASLVLPLTRGALATSGIIAISSSSRANDIRIRSIRKRDGPSRTRWPP